MPARECHRLHSLLYGEMKDTIWEASIEKRTSVVQIWGLSDFKPIIIPRRNPLRSSVESYLRGLAQPTLIKRLVTIINIYQRPLSVMRSVPHVAFSLLCCLFFPDAPLMVLISFPGPDLPTLPGRRLQVHQEGQQGEW